jgi:hypothetical protein
VPDVTSLLLQQAKLAVLGVADPRLSPSWGDSPTLDSTSLGVTSTGALKAPFSGFVQAHSLVTLVDKSAAAWTTSGTVVEMHPAAYLALARLYLKLQDTSSTTTVLQRPVPRYLHLASGSGAPTGAVRPGDSVGTGSTMTFHDARGMIIDAGAVAACFAALMTLLPGLSTGAAGDLTSGLTALVGTATSIMVLACTPHGGSFTDPGTGKGVGLVTGSSTTIDEANRLGASPVTVTSRDNLKVHVEDSTSLVRAGLFPSGLIGSADVALPALASGVTLNRDFFRVVCCDLATYLPGARTAGAVDTGTAAEPAPTVRDGINVTTLLDGISTLQAVGTVAGAAGSAGQALLASPDIEPVRLPAAGTADSIHWPAHPAWPPSPAATAWDPAGSAALRSGTVVSASWVDATSPDVFVEIAAGNLPVGAFVRVFPRRMVFPDTLAAGPSVVRGDGTATVAPATDTACVIRLSDPLALDGQPQPTGSTTLNFDLLVVPRPASGAPQPRLLGGFSPTIAAPVSPALTATAPTDFDEPDGLSAVVAANRAISKAGVLGFPNPSNPLAALDWPTSGSAADIASFVVSLAESLGDEGSPPRDAPRLPTMARRETVAAARTGGTTQTWQALLCGGWLTPRTRTGAPRSGNPGWPAQPETDTVAATVDGALAYDLARAALRRTSSLANRMPSLNSTTDWIAPAASTSTTNRWAGAALQTVAASCETPGLALISDPSVLPDGTDTSQWTSALSSLPSSVQSVLNFVPHTQQAFAEVRREAFAAKYGRRDAQVALRRAIGEARELIYIEAPRFGASSHTQSADAPPQTTPTDGSAPVADTLAEWDIVASIAARLTAVPTLRVVIGLPKLPDYPQPYWSFALFEYQARQAALNALTAAGAGRVTMFHPIGFPGRPLHTGTTVVCVDDVWLLVGASSPTRRGLTFDGSSDLVLFDRQLDDGYSSGIRAFRRALLARHMGAAAPTSGTTSSATWVKLARPAPAALAINELVNDEAGNGLVEGLYTPVPGAEHSTAAAASLADPDGRNVSLLVLAGQALVGGLEMLSSS